jgi:hypothetical protein
MEITGVIDRFEEGYAVIVFDDGQQLDWPRDRLPASIKSGQAVKLAVQPGSDFQAAAQPAESWAGNQRGPHITLPDGQTFNLPETELTTAAATTETPVSLSLAPDEAETKARRARVKSLLDDIFGKE